VQAVPLFLSEIAPPRIRGGLNALFQLNITVGILFANLVNFGTSKYCRLCFSSKYNCIKLSLPLANNWFST
jgi:hypothetical protein